MPIHTITYMHQSICIELLEHTLAFAVDSRLELKEKSRPDLLNLVAELCSCFRCVQP